MGTYVIFSFSLWDSLHRHAHQHARGQTHVYSCLHSRLHCTHEWRSEVHSEQFFQFKLTEWAFSELKLTAVLELKQSVQSILWIVLDWVKKQFLNWNWLSEQKLTEWTLLLWLSELFLFKNHYVFSLACPPSSSLPVNSLCFRAAGFSQSFPCDCRQPIVERLRLLRLSRASEPCAVQVRPHTFAFVPHFSYSTILFTTNSWWEPQLSHSPHTYILPCDLSVCLLMSLSHTDHYLDLSSVPQW
jgi:hypothetical protein